MTAILSQIASNVFRKHRAQIIIGGTVTTKHGHKITPFKPVVTPHWKEPEKTIEFASQPRIQQLRTQMEPLREAGKRKQVDERIPFRPDFISYCMKKGEFFLHSDLVKNGRKKAIVLGVFDPLLEEELVREAASQTIHGNMIHLHHYKVEYALRLK